MNTSVKILQIAAWFICLALPNAALIARNDSFNSRRADTSIMIKGGIGYGYSFYGVARGSSFNINPGTGIDLDTSILARYKSVAFETNFLFSTVNDTHYGASGKQFRTEGAGKLIVVDPKIGFYKALGWDELDYLFVYGGARFWNADYAYSRVGSYDYPLNDSMSGFGFLAGARFVSTFNGFIRYWPFSLWLGAYLSAAPLNSIEREGRDLTITDQSNYSPGFEAGLGLTSNSDGLAFLLNSRYDIIATKFSLKESAGVARVSSSAGVGSLKILVSAIKNINF